MLNFEEQLLEDEGVQQESGTAGGLQQRSPRKAPPMNTDERLPHVALHASLTALSLPCVHAVCTSLNSSRVFQQHNPSRAAPMYTNKRLSDTALHASLTALSLPFVQAVYTSFNSRRAFQQCRRSKAPPMNTDEGLPDFALHASQTALSLPCVHAVYASSTAGIGHADVNLGTGTRSMMIVCSTELFTGRSSGKKLNV